jgi:hypothetical protein
MISSTYWLDENENKVRNFNEKEKNLVSTNWLKS